MHPLNHEQQSCVISRSRCLFINSLAGTGKTETLVRRLATIVEECPTSSVLVLTYTKTASSELQSRISSLFTKQNLPIVNIVINTYHAAALSFLRHFFPHNKCTILDSESTSEMLTESYRHVLGDVEEGNVLDEDKVKKLNKLQLDRLYAVACAEDVLLHEKSRKSIDFWSSLGLSDCQLIDFLTKVYFHFNHLKSIDEVMDYSDLLLCWLRVLESQDNATSSPGFLTYDHILADELNDSSFLQLKILSLLTRNSESLTVVGDWYQSIMSFAGSNFSNKYHFRTIFPDCEEICLSLNYRSKVGIIELANSVLNRLGSKLLLEGNSTNNDSKPRIVIFNSQLKEAQFIGQKVKNLIDSGKVKYGDVAILFRSSIDSFLLEFCLFNIGIHYLKIGGIFFKDSSFGQYLHSFLTVCHFLITNNCSKPMELYWRVLISRIPFLTEKEVNQIIDLLRVFNWYPFDLIKFRDFSNNKASCFYSSFCNFFISICSSKPDFSTCLRIFYKKFLKGAVSFHFSRFRNFLSIFVKFSSNFSFDSMFLFFDSPEPPPNSIYLSSIHSSKGLGFETVFISGLCKGIFPSENPFSSNFMEELRLFYVAITRTKSKLIITCPLSRDNYLSPLLNQQLVNNCLIILPATSQELVDLGRLFDCHVMSDCDFDLLCHLRQLVHHQLK
ncbi:hypothetical protein P9112_002451 [Eukaryota sp. TZLM1-RC]